MNADLQTTYRIYEPPLRAICGADVPKELCRQWMRRYRDWFADDSEVRVVPVPQSEGGTLSETSGPASPPPLLAKRDALPLARHLLYALRGRSARSVRAFRLGRALAAAEVPTARPLAVLQRRAPGLRCESCLILQRLEAPHLRDFLESALSGGDQAADFKTRLFHALAETIATLHRAGFRQRDLKAANILVAEEGNGFAVSLIDFEGMTQFRAAPSWRVRIRDLARLGVSLQAVRMVELGIDRQDWEFLVTEYLTAFDGQAPQRSELEKALRTMDHWARRKISRNRRRRRPIT